MKSTKLVPVLPLSLAAAVMMFNQSVNADQAVSVEYGMPVHVDCVVEESGCQNSPGPWITLDGEIALGGLQARLIFQNNDKGTHTTVTNTSYDMALLLDGQIVLPKQPIKGGVGGNPHIWIKFTDGNGKDLCDEIYLGRCVQGLHVSEDLVINALAIVNAHAEDCSNHPGPIITVDGGLVLGGLHGSLIFRNALKGPHVAEDIQDMAIILEGSSIELPKAPVNGGAGGNPIISLQLLTGQGDPIGTPVRLGRCNKI